MEPVVGLELVVNEDDIPVDTKNRIRALEKGTKLLSGEYVKDIDAKRIIFDALPGVIATRIKSITPNHFNVSEIQLKMTISGQLFGAGVKGDMIVKFAPDT